MNKKCMFGKSQSALVRLSIAAITLLLGTMAAFASTPQGSFERTFQVSGPVDLEVLTRSGDITVHNGPAGSVLIRGKIYVGDHWLFGGRKADVSSIEQNPPVRQQGNNVRIDYIDEHDISVSYEITVPADTAVRARSGSGDQLLQGTHGKADMQTGSGDVKLESLTGDIHVQTGSGNLKAHEIAGPVTGHTGSGDIEVSETSPGNIELHTGSGNITVRGIQGAFHGETGSGDITAEGMQTAGWEVRTGSGNVHLHVPDNAAFNADISTNSGTIYVNSPVEMTVQGRVDESKKAIRGKVRGGGPELLVHTGSGDIHVQ